MTTRTLLSLITLLICGLLHAKQTMHMATHPSLSPDGKTILFAWNGDLWSTSIEGGRSTRLTTHPAYDYAPRFTNDGKSICFGSTRAGSYQVFIMPANGGPARQITHHSEGSFLEDIHPDGKSLLIRAVRDFPGRKPYRLYEINLSGKQAEQLLIPGYAEYGRYSPDGKKVLITREGTRRYRKGYHGTMASQIWQWDQPTNAFNQSVSSQFGCREPLYNHDQSGFYYTQGSPNGFNLWFHEFKSGNSKQITHFEDDSVMQPFIAPDGSGIVFRHLFDLYYLSLKRLDNKPHKLNLWHDADIQQKTEEERIIKSTEDIAFSPSGLEIIFTAEGDIWAMDTVMKKPHRLTKTPAAESDLWFSHNGESIYYMHDDGINKELRRMEKSSKSEFWWQAKDPKHTTIIQSSEKPLSIIPGPKGKKIAYTTYPGNLWVSNPDGTDPIKLTESWSAPAAQWSPDGKWMAYAMQNNNFNSDIFITKADGSSPPVNISRHPDMDFSPVWSPNGRRIAFIGRHNKENYEIFYLDLYKSDEHKDPEADTLERARKAMEKDPAYKNLPKNKIKKVIKKLTGKEKAEDKTDTEQENFDFENIHQRLRKIKVTESSPTRLIWSHDSKKIIFQKRSNKKQTFIVEAKDKSKATKLADATGTPIRMGSKGKLYWLSDGVPATLKDKSNTLHTFTIYTNRDLTNWKQMAFRKAWNTMRDMFYDENMNHKDWNAIRNKYEQAARQSNNSDEFDRIISMMLGELNASHMGFRTSKKWPTEWKPDNKWKQETVHLGTRIDHTHTGKGWKINSVIPESPADLVTPRIQPGEIITHVNGTEISSSTPLSKVLYQRLSEAVHLTISNTKGESREIKLQPITYKAARALAKQAKIEFAEASVNQLSKGKLGYIHITRMMWDEFEKFEHHLYEQGYGKEGLVIDVRDNGGGFTTDHLLTALCQPRHAITIPRNGGTGYPQDRIVYATWNKPIIVLCNQNSFSNAEIFAHAIRLLNRGKIIGVASAGGVISTGSRKIMDAGTIRLPFRGWFKAADGKDMELNGAEPHVTIWNKPGELSQGKDVQLEKAIKLLLEECQNTPDAPKPQYRATNPSK